MYIYNSNSNYSNNICSFCVCGDNTSSLRGKDPRPPGENFLITVFLEKKKASKYAKLMVELHVCDNLTKFTDFFIFNKKFFERNVIQKCHRKSSWRQYIKFFRTCIWLYFAVIQALFMKNNFLLYFYNRKKIGITKISIFSYNNLTQKNVLWWQQRTSFYYCCCWFTPYF